MTWLTMVIVMSVNLLIKNNFEKQDLEETKQDSYTPHMYNNKKRLLKNINSKRKYMNSFFFKFINTMQIPSGCWLRI